ncbi:MULTISPECIES: DUF6314 family protein [unclassified Rhizobium]|uniref:DUF6314 family protein n=1 Tax=unclassified Rhizobium TaxID=2613769 RepID=UPI001ADC9725|nr:MULTISPECIES: DUF6314 family protein [unclassified Rhizobium]MBO9168397.1 hypothetical protein [Rhizobium sp. L245/93]QXZ88198.1 hypothetical protein J5287_31300 [Rhizobium sp. K1/93]QXZ94372.1 hypothetical protein J5280_30835 [Rhizobium sp. K15/93]QYA05734.1 hypothetical protein J5278_29800 [Rhizobium sp. B21/90]
MLVGEWRVHRKICDYRARSTIAFVGHATIIESAFLEHGQLHPGGRALDCRRAYTLMMGDSDVLVFFPDGAEFVRLAFKPIQAVVHLCGDDVYCGQFLIRSPHDWAEIRSVTGPRKRYRSVTHYRREPLSPHGRIMSAGI